MKRKSRRAKCQKVSPFSGDLQLIEPDAAAVDVGSRSHRVAVNPQRDPNPVREFGAFTADLISLADWLAQCEAKSVVMEATGVYWVSLYELLERRGRSRTKIVEAAAQQQLRMQKALTLMNIHLHHVISDLSGLTGLSIVRAIVGGERDPNRLARLRDPRIRASKETIQKSLEGNWQEELLFDLKIALESYDHFQGQIAAYDEQIRQELKEVESKVNLANEPLPAARLKACRKRPGMSQQDQLDLREELYRISGVDLTRIDGISLQTAQKVFFEIGTDVSAWSDEKKFSSWLGLSPNHRISGGKVLKRSSRKVVNPLSVALRLAARTLRNSHSALGANFRRLIAKIGMPKAITAMARKLAVLLYRMLKYGTQYVDKGMQHYESKYQETKLQYLRAQAAKFGMILLPKQAAATH